MNKITPLGPALPSPVGAGPTEITPAVDKALRDAHRDSAKLVGYLESPSDGYGKRPRCSVCGRGFYGCICDVPEPDVMPVEDMKRIMPRLFDEDSGWALAERSAYGMPKA